MNMEATMAMQWTIEDDKVAQLGGKGSDYGAWLVGRDGDGGHQHIMLPIGQCGDAPEGDARARRLVQQMVDGLNHA